MFKRSTCRKNGFRERTRRRESTQGSPTESFSIRIMIRIIYDLNSVSLENLSYSFWSKFIFLVHFSFRLWLILFIFELGWLVKIGIKAKIVLRRWSELLSFQITTGIVHNLKVVIHEFLQEKLSSHRFNNSIIVLELDYNHIPTETSHTPRPK